MNISDVVEAVKAVRNFAKVITENEGITKADMEVLSKISPSIKEGYDNMAKWIEGGENDA